MPPTYARIAKTVLTTDTATVTFSGIPATYTDLVLRANIRATTGTNPTFYFYLNENQTALYSNTNLGGTGSSITAGRNANDFAMGYGSYPGSLALVNTYGYVELYLANYTNSLRKVTAMNYAQENNTAEAFMGAVASLFRSTSAITSISFTNPTFAAGSSFYLYGIKNS